MRLKTLSVNQPYFFPYIGYFQLIHASDKFISLDDVNFIPRGWINRNRILINGEPAYISLQISDASQNHRINETRINTYDGWKEDLLKKLRISYSRAPYYTNCFSVVRSTLESGSDLISDIALSSILEVCNYVGLKRGFGRSRTDKELKGADKIIEICKTECADMYVNLPGGKELYSREQFAAQGIALKFIEPELREYRQFREPFVPGLSIIDVMMFNPPEKVLEMISSYELN